LLQRQNKKGEEMNILSKIIAACVWLIILAIYLVSIPLAIIATIIVFPVWYIVEKLRPER